MGCGTQVSAGLQSKSQYQISTSGWLGDCACALGQRFSSCGSQGVAAWPRSQWLIFSQSQGLGVMLEHPPGRKGLCPQRRWVLQLNPFAYTHFCFLLQAISDVGSFPCQPSSGKLSQCLKPLAGSPKGFGASPKECGCAEVCFDSIHRYFPCCTASLRQVLQKAETGGVSPALAITGWCLGRRWWCCSGLGTQCSQPASSQLRLC